MTYGQNIRIGIVDEPNPGNSEDTLGIDRHATALTNFIKYTTTPMTIGIQGEWGSGKTSLLNSIYHSLDSKGSYKQIWINSWEHSLLSSPEEALIKIINAILYEMMEADQDKARQEKIKKVASNLMKGAFRMTAAAIGGNKAGDVAEEFLGNNVNTIKDLRKQLDELSNDISERPTNPYEKIIIYVDDLDRIEPKDAVKVLELLKNIFSIPHCVFILAIDYQVVVKGLEHKFGKRTEENEWEFRAFFDKIIQLPFTMPMGQYNIGRYVSDLLKQIGFIDNDDQFDEEINQIISYSIGGNPRSLKRLVNSLALINIFSQIDSNQEELGNKGTIDDAKDLLLFSLVCLQISFPFIYELLVKKPDFLSWDDDTAFELTKLKEEKEKEKFERDFKIAKNTIDFDEPWEQALYRICYPTPRYRSRVINISKFFSFLKDELLKDIKDEEIKDIIAEVIDATAVTSITSTDDSQTQITDREKGKPLWFDEGSWNNIARDAGIPKDAMDICKLLTDQIRLEYSTNNPIDLEFKYTEKFITISSNKHKAAAIQPEHVKSRLGWVKLDLLKTYKNNYRLPSINNIRTDHIRVYKGLEKPTTSAFCDRYSVIIKSKQDYMKNKAEIFKLIRESFIIAKEEWESRLQINVREGSFSSKTEKIVGDKTKADNFASKMLSDDYREKV